MIFRLYGLFLRRPFLFSSKLRPDRGLFLLCAAALFLRFDCGGIVRKGDRLARLYLLLQLSGGGRLRRIIDKPVKSVVVLLYGVLDVL